TRSKRDWSSDVCSSDLLNIRLKDIDWEHHCLNIIQPKTTHLNILPLSKEVGWAIIDYTQHARPTCQNEYLFVKMKYPFEKMEYRSEERRVGKECRYRMR